MKLGQTDGARIALQYLSQNTNGGIPASMTGFQLAQRTLRAVELLPSIHHLCWLMPLNLICSTLKTWMQMQFSILLCTHKAHAAGPSDLNSFAWWWCRSSDGAASHDLCSAQATVDCCLCSLVKLGSISVLVACRLIPLNKCPCRSKIKWSNISVIVKAILHILKRSRAGLQGHCNLVLISTA